MATVSGNENNVWILIADGKADAALSLLQTPGFDLNVKDENGYTPIHAAASYGEEGVLRYLIEHGANVNVRDSSQETPLHYCEEVKIAKLLLDHGADPTLRNADGQTPAEAAEEDENDDLRDFLQEAISNTATRTATQQQTQEKKDETDEKLLMINFSDLSQLTYISSLLTNAQPAGSDETSSTSTTDGDSKTTIWSGIRGDIVIVEADKEQIDRLEQHLTSNLIDTSTITPFVTFTSDPSSSSSSSSSSSETNSILSGAPSKTQIKVKRLTRKQGKALIDWSAFGDASERMKNSFEQR